MPNRFGRSLLPWVAIVAVAVVLGLVLSNRLENRRDLNNITDFWTYARNGQIESVVIHERDIEGKLREGVAGKKDEPLNFRLDYNFQTDQDFRKELMDATKGRTAIKYDNGSLWWSPILNILLMVGLMLVIWFFLFRRMSSAGGGAGFLGGFGRSKHKLATKEQSRLTFNDIAGIQDAKEELTEIIEFLKNPRKFQRLGGRVPRGVLLIGEPGCGKTLMAKAIAGEAEVPFFSISGSDFVEMFVGVGASRVRDLFRQAKESSPCIIFLDEIDAVGRRRAYDPHGSTQESAQTLNAILVEMDGFDSSDQVIVIAATNRADVLDPALTRPGRFDRQITVPLPDLQGRCDILKIYANKIKCGPDVDLRRLARGTPMFSGAELAALVNEAAIAATMSQKDFIEQTDLEEARDKVRWGRAHKNREVDEKEKEITAYHEAGHALVQLLTPGADPLHKVSILSRGSMGGATFSLPEKDRYLYTRNYCKALLRVCLGGRLAEEMFCKDVSSGAASDIAQATELARRMVLDWGMSEKLGMVRYAGDERAMMMPELGGKNYSENTARIIDEEVKRLIDEAYNETRNLLQERHDSVKRVAEMLLKYETLSGDEAQMIVDGKSLDRPTMGDLLEREHAKTPKIGAAIAPPAVTPGQSVPPLPEPG
jgi:cell division protease FtsH